ncbi:unnamed protein product [Amoebophrya sp. A25]|nr:unnamed protein product [Amoebophrya sp. A25]|eukprot:GSA25T00008259001.1
MENHDTMKDKSAICRVAVMAPASHIAALVPHVFEKGVARLKLLLEETFPERTIQVDELASCFGKKEQHDLGAEEAGLCSFTEERYPKPTSTTTSTSRKIVQLSPQERAQEVNDALFSEGEKKYDFVFCTIGGLDSLRLRPFLRLPSSSASDEEDLHQIKAKKFEFLPSFFGYSDITSLQCELWNLGVPCYYGGAILVQFGESGVDPHVNAYTKASITAALKRTWFELKPHGIFVPDAHNWFDPSKQSLPPRETPAPEHAWYFLQRDQQVGGGQQGQGQTLQEHAHLDTSSPRKRPLLIGQEDAQTFARGTLFGGCTEVLMTYLASGYPLRVPTADERIILFLETSESMPHAGSVADLIRALSLRGFLKHLVGVIVALPKIEFLGQTARPDPESFRKAQKTAILEALKEHYVDYTCSIAAGPLPLPDKMPVVFNIHAGHVDPQAIVPLGRECLLDVERKRIFFNYGDESWRDEIEIC